MKTIKCDCGCNETFFYPKEYDFLMKYFARGDKVVLPAHCPEGYYVFGKTAHLRLAKRFGRNKESPSGWAIIALALFIVLVFVYIVIPLMIKFLNYLGLG